MPRTGEYRAGEPAAKRGRLAEIIGPPGCPILKRWTLIPWRAGKEGRWKLMVHHFLPNADDRDVHDHPRPFWTFVLRGRYDDLGLDAAGRIYLRERMRPGMLRFRPAAHAHRTRVGPDGCWTIVVMGALQRPWGFWRSGRWWFWRDYERAFGFGMRCDTDDE